MFSQMPGARISPSEVTSIGRFGFWLICRDAEYFVPYSDYPVFKSATIDQIYAMEESRLDSCGGNHWMPISNLRHWSIRRDSR